MFLRSLAIQSYESLLVRRALGGETVARVMIPDPVTVSPHATIRAVVDDSFLGRGFRGFPVAEDGRAVGLITIDDVRAVPRERWDDARVEQHMKPLEPALWIEPEAPLGTALGRMGAKGRNRLLVMSGDRLVGMLTKDALARFVELHSLEKSG
jgi:CBS domain-containing protein